MRLSVVLVALLGTLASPHATAKPAAKRPPSPSPLPNWKLLPLPLPAMPAPHATAKVESDGAQLHVARFGKGEPVILLHGGMGNGDHWAHQVPVLADLLHVIVIDSRGQGRSTRPKARPSYAQMARDVIAVMDHLKLERASIVGWSDGGEVALELAIHHAARVDKLVVFGATYDATGNKPRSGGRSRTFALYAKKCRADYARLSPTPKQFDAHIAWLAPIWKNPLPFSRDDLRGINVPALVLHGEHDEIAKTEHAREMAKLIPGARLQVFQDTSHFVLWQDPARFNQAVVDFLTQSAPRRP